VLRLHYGKSDPTGGEHAARVAMGKESNIPMANTQLRD
jgi:hypothetical protein